MTTVDRRTTPTWPDEQDEAHPAGEMALVRKSAAGARARALAGMTLAVGACAVVAAGLQDTTVSAPGTL